jgi:putative NIF3 family GTP cyclohydrolase 1 type 2
VDVYGLEPVDEMPLARIGFLPSPMSLSSFRELVDEKLSTRSLAWGKPSSPIRKVAVVGGAGDSHWRASLGAGADAFLTGEIRQHVALEGTQAGISMIASGHHATEHPGCRALRDRLAAAIPVIEWDVFEPQPGQSGRPL